MYMYLKRIWWRLAVLRSPNDVYEIIDSSIKPYYYPVVQRLNGNVFAVNINNSKMGFFAHLNWCLFVLYYCQRKGLTPYLELTSENYLSPMRGPDWFKYYFSNLALRNKGYDDTFRPPYVTRVRQIGELKLPDWCYHDLSLDQAAELVRNTLELRPEIISKVENFLELNFNRRKVLGIHFRGTDKATEAPRVKWEYCRNTIRNYLGAHPETDALFVTSDEAAFLDYIKIHFTDITVCSHDDHYRSAGTVPTHILGTGGDNYLKGLDALVNSLLLSHCSVIVRSSSFLSAWSSIFNPQVPVILLNKPHSGTTWFPETIIMQRSLNQYLPDAN